jgi:polyhydroxybutyrate depolymerase
MDAWAARQQCRTQVLEQLAHGVQVVTYGACAGGAAVRLYTLEGGRHVWPQAAEGFSATDAMLKFFNLQAVTDHQPRTA